MIQRIQSVYFALTVVLAFILLNGHILQFRDSSGPDIFMDFKGIWKTTETGDLSMIQNVAPAAIVIALISLVSLVAILLFKNRSLQKKVTAALIFLSLILSGLFIVYLLGIRSKYNEGIIFAARTPVPLVMLILGILAYRGIKKDDELVKSYDRLR
ncbi:MAG: DUF4293 domain-containing protein [Bacteroidales bacterium]